MITTNSSLRFAGWFNKSSSTTPKQYKIMPSSDIQGDKFYHQVESRPNASEQSFMEVIPPDNSSQRKHTTSQNRPPSHISYESDGNERPSTPHPPNYHGTISYANGRRFPFHEEDHCPNISYQEMEKRIAEWKKLQEAQGRVVILKDNKDIELYYPTPE
jgi:hypothetical protein